MYPVQVNAWQRDESVSFAGTQISESIRVRPGASPDDPVGYAQAIHDVAMARRAAGQRVVFRPWQEYQWPDHPRPYYRNDNNDDDPNNRFNRLGPYEPTVLPEQMTAWNDGFAGEIIRLQTNPDYVMVDAEDRPLYWSIPLVMREGYFAPVATDDANNPYPNPPSPYIGLNLGTSGNPLVGPFISEYNQWAFEDMAASNERLWGGLWDEQQQAQQAADVGRFGTVPESGEVDPRPISNYGDTVAAWTFGDTSNRPERLPNAAVRIANIAAPIAYYNRRLGLALYEAEPEYTTPRQIANRERWKNMLYRINGVRSAAAVEPGDVHPWVQAPGWGWNGGEAWAGTVQLPFELVLWRLWIAHLEAMGVQTYNLWNPIPNDPHSPITHAFMAAYWVDRWVGPLVRDLPRLEYDADEFSTGDLVTRFADLFEMEVVYFRRGTPRVKYAEGWPWSPDDPIVISEGETGDAELADLVKAIEINQGMTAGTLGTQEITGEEEPTMGSVTYTVSRHQHAPEVKRKIATGERCGLIFEVDASLTDLVCEAVVRRRPGAKAIHTYAPDVQAKEGGGHTVTLETEDTADWPEGLLICDVMIDSVETGPARVARMLIDVERSTTP